MALSPMMQHYLSVKEKYNDCFLFYRLGDFYELFFDDAKKASEILGLVLTGKDCGLSERAPMCGVPFHSVDTYVAKIVEAGGKVAICEQLEDPSEAKGIVDRGVVKVITAGTVIEDKQLDECSNSFICSAYKKDFSVGLAWADITTGEFLCCMFVGEKCVELALSQMQKIVVKEIICNEEMFNFVRNYPEVEKGILPKFTTYYEWSFTLGSATECLLKHFNVKTLDSFSINDKKDAICASGALMQYLNETQMRSLINIDSIKFVSSSDSMELDTVAVRNLELVRSLDDEKKRGSLLWLLDKTKTAMGARLLYSMLLSPLHNIDEINYRLDGVEELFNSSIVRMSLSDLLKQVKDIERLSGKISNGNLNPRDMVALSVSLSVIPNIKMQLSGFNSAIIRKIFSDVIDMTDIVNLISTAIVDENTPQLTKDGGFIKQGYNKELDELRRIRENSTKYLTELETRERDATGIRNLKIGYNKVFGYYIEVSNSFLDKVPSDYQRRQTLTGGERFITTELKELEEKILNAEDKSVKIENHIFDDIKGVLSERISDFKKISSAIALLDVLTSFAEVSKSSKYVRPEISEAESPLVIKGGRHPVVEALSKEKFISNDTLLDEGENRTVVLTGPNMAGKSTYMRQVAIITIMAHIGCFVPASSASIPLVDRIYTRVGASDNLIMDQSTFMVEMIEVATIVKNATKHSLLILDEVGRGTSTYDGLAIAWAVIEYITKQIGAKTLFATHYHELIALEDSIDGIKNYKVTAKEINGSIVFLRKVMRGGANRSFGIEVASFAGVPAEITDKAKKLLRSIEKNGSESRSDKSIYDNADNVTEDEEGKPDTAVSSEVVNILSDLDMNSLSPMQAFMILSDLVDKVKF